MELPTWQFVTVFLSDYGIPLWLSLSYLY